MTSSFRIPVSFFLTLIIFGANSISAGALKRHVAQPQNAFDVAEKLKISVAKNARCWKLDRENLRRNAESPEVEQDWNCRKEWVRVDMFQAESAAKASEMFREQRDQIVQSPGKIINTYTFGDESRVTSYSPYSTSSYVFFRRGKIFVRIDANLTKRGKTETTLKNAVLFAQLLAEEMK